MGKRADLVKPKANFALFNKVVFLWSERCMPILIWVRHSSVCGTDDVTFNPLLFTQL